MKLVSSHESVTLCHSVLALIINSGFCVSFLPFLVSVVSQLIVS